MPRVPEQVQQVNVASAPSVRQTPGATAQAFGAGVGQSMRSVAEALRKFAIQKDKAKATEAFNSINADINSYLHDPQEGVYTRKGKNASGLPQELNGYLESAYGKYTKDMNPRQKEMFNQMYEPKRQATTNNVMTHTRREFESYAISEADAFIKNAARDAEVAYNNEASIQEAMNRGEWKIKEIASDLGMSAEEKENKLHTFRTQTYTNVINRLISEEQLDQAKNYFEKKKDMIDPKQRQALKENLERKDKTVEAQEATDILVSKHGLDGESLALEEARKKYSGELEDDIVNRIQVRYIDMKRHHNEVLVKQQTEYLDAIDASPTLAEQLKIVGDIKNRTIRENVEDYVIAKNQPPPEKKTFANSVASDGILDLIRAGVIQNKAQLTVMAKKGGLTGSQYESCANFLDGQGKIKGVSLNKAEEVLKTIMGNKAEMQDYPGFYTTLTDLLPDDAERIDDRKLFDAATVILKETLPARVKPKGFFNFKETVMEQAEKGVPFAEVDLEISRQDRNNIIKALKANKKPVTETMIQKVYKSGMIKDVTGMDYSGLNRQSITKQMEKEAEKVAYPGYVEPPKPTETKIPVTKKDPTVEENVKKIEKEEQKGGLSEVIDAYKRLGKDTKKFVFDAFKRGYRNIRGNE